VLAERLTRAENGTVATALLSDLVERGQDPEQGILFVLDGVKALRKAVRAVPCRGRRFTARRRGRRLRPEPGAARGANAERRRSLSARPTGVLRARLSPNRRVDSQAMALAGGARAPALHPFERR
jgi:hypothetical protein